MIKQKNILMVSNGHGEDLITANLIQSLLNKEKNNLNISVLPIVGEGSRFEGLPVKILGPRENLPSGGFARNSLKILLTDIKGGLFTKTFQHIKALKKQKNKANVSIVVGDVYILLLTGLFTGGKIIFLPTAKSEYIDGHYKIEK